MVFKKSLKIPKK